MAVEMMIGFYFRFTRFLHRARSQKEEESFISDNNS